jgi:hypothetical protein
MTQPGIPKVSQLMPRHTVHYTRTAGRRFEGLWSR